MRTAIGTMCVEVQEARTKGTSIGCQELDLYIYNSIESCSLEKGDANMENERAGLSL